MSSFGLTTPGTQKFKNREVYVENNNMAFNNPPVAVNDTFIFSYFNNESSLTGNLFENDFDPEGDEFVLTFLYAPKSGEMAVNCDGIFTYSGLTNTIDTVRTKYIICETMNPDNYGEAEIILIIKTDHDNDGVADEFDIDNDNDGILDADETTEADTDNDGIPNYLDIDSDGDGITDNIEAQEEGNYIAPFWTDSDRDGWDDAYDPDNNGSYFDLADTDEDGTPDFLDTNSDDDDQNDIIEASIADNQASPITPLFSDSDKDGLDDIFDVQEGYINSFNPTASNVLLPDSDNNGVRDWRDFKSNDVIPGDESNLKNKLQFIIYPNPTVQKFIIEFSAKSVNGDIFVDISNLKGQLVCSQKLYIQNMEIDPGLLNPGQYIVTLTNGNSTFSKPLVINY